MGRHTDKSGNVISVLYPDEIHLTIWVDIASYLSLADTTSSLCFVSLSFSFHVAWANGEPLRILYPTDSKGRLCGVGSGVE